MKEENGSGLNAVKDLQSLAQIGLALSQERQLGAILEMIVNAARSMTNADAGTLYILDSEARCLRFCIMQNETTRTKINAVTNPDAPIPEPVPLYINGAPNNGNVSSFVALTGNPVKISDVYSAQGFNFSGVKHYDSVSGYRSKSMLVVPMRDHNDDIIGILQLLNAQSAGSGKVTDFSERHEVLVSSLASQAAVSITNRRLISAMQKDLEEIKRLQQAEEELGEKLKKAYLETETANVELRAAMAQTGVVRKIWMLFVLVLILAGSAWKGLETGVLGTVLSETASPEMADSRAIETVRVANSPVTANLSFVGQIEPLTQKVFLSPFSGKVIEKYYLEGQLVKAGDPLLRLDTTELEIKVRQARSASIRAKKEHIQVKEWAAGPRVTQARLSLARQKAILDNLKRKLDEAKVLFDKGIIPGSELESAAEAFENQKISAQAAEDEVKSLLLLMTEKLTAPPVIRLRGIKKNFRVGILDLPVLKGIDLDIYNGEMAAITGTSGGGKSTLMNIIGLLDEPTSGTYAFEGREVVNLDDDELSGIRNEKIGFVFQQFNLLPRLSAAENVAIPLLYRGESIRKSNLIARSFLEKVGMGDRADHNPMELSGGQQQRVAIARALAGNPSIILADEPTGALDTRVGQEIMDLFLRLNKEDAITIVMITHDPRIAAQCEKRFNICDGLVESRSEAVA